MSGTPGREPRGTRAGSGGEPAQAEERPRRYQFVPADFSPERPATDPMGPIAAPDPVRFCVFTTVALLAWALGPPTVLMAMGALGVWAYARAMRAGLHRTRCVLRRPWLVLAYLVAAFALGATVTALRLARLLT